MQTAKQIAAVLALLACALPVAASPTVFGPTGLLVTPTADTPGTAKIDLGGWFTDDLATSGSLNIGIGAGLEVNGAWVDPDGPAKGEGIVSAKWRFRQSSITRPAVAVGVMDLTDEFEITPYVVVQKEFKLAGSGISAHGGFARAGSLLDGSFAGAEATLASKYKVMAEYDGDDVNAGVRFPATDRVEITAGKVKDGFAVGATFSIR
jgi:hypothetical protein